MKNIKFVNLPYKYAAFREQLHKDLDAILDSGQFILGNDVCELEEKIASMLNVKHTLGVANGTDALMLSMRYFGIGKGDEVITTPMSYLASTSSIHLVGATPVFADIDESLNLSLTSIEANITEKTKAIVVVHLAGNPANINLIKQLADKYKLLVIEDCAQAFGAEIGGNYIGSFGDASTVSFHPLKNLGGIGDGGMIFTNSEKCYDWIKIARNHGHTSRDDSAFWSVNSRLDALQARFISTQLETYSNELLRRRSLAKLYKEKLIHSIEFPLVYPTAKPSYNWFVILCENRDDLVKYLASHGIETKVHYPNLITELSANEGEVCKHDQIPNAIFYTSRILSLPIGEHVTKEDVSNIVDIINNFYQ